MMRPWRIRKVLLAGPGMLLGFLALWELMTRVVPLPATLSYDNPGTLDLLDRDGKLLGRFASPSARVHRPVPLSSMGKWFPRVAVQLEDKRFYLHHGVDFTALGGAVLRNVRLGRAVSGASTITQQVVKLATGRTRRYPGAKAYEILAARRLEREWSKDRILEYYLNNISFGNRLLGVEAASEVYFGKPATSLTLEESMFLAGLPQAPSRYNPWTRREAANLRYRNVVRICAAAGLLDNCGQSTRPEPSIGRHLLANAAPHFCQAVRRRFPALRGSVRTTLDSKLQTLAERLTTDCLARLENRGVRHAAVVILENDSGAVRAMVGSGNFEGPGGQINGALVRRSAGSTLKPFVYAQAFDERLLTPCSILPDTPDAARRRFRGYAPSNFDGRFGGPVRVREALGSSLNVPAVVAMARVGVSSAYDHLVAAGISLNHNSWYYGVGLVLGNAEVKLIELTTAFSAFTRRGSTIRYRLLEDDPIALRQWIRAESAFQIADILADNEARQRTFGVDNALVFPGMQIPCKTGTSSSFRDSWCVGSTAQKTIGVWVGNFDGHPTQQVTSADGPAILFRNVVESLLSQGDRPPALDPSELNLRKIRICSLSGLLPCEACPKVVDEWLTPESIPTANSTSFFEQTATGRVRIRLPFEYAAWCQSAHNWMGAEIAEAEGKLEILNPKDGAVYQLVPFLPEKQQMIALEGVSTSRDPLRWAIDGEEVISKAGLVLWQLRPGKHGVDLRCGGLSRSISFEVVR